LTHVEPGSIFRSAADAAKASRASPDFSHAYGKRPSFMA